jgi:hypothetical protein
MGEHPLAAQVSVPISSVKFWVKGWVKGWLRKALALLCQFDWYVTQTVPVDPGCMSQTGVMLVEGLPAPYTGSLQGVVTVTVTVVFAPATTKNRLAETSTAATTMAEAMAT